MRPRFARVRFKSTAYNILLLCTVIFEKFVTKNPSGVCFIFYFVIVDFISTLRHEGRDRAVHTSGSKKILLRSVSTGPRPEKVKLPRYNVYKIHHIIII